MLLVACVGCTEPAGDALEPLQSSPSARHGNAGPARTGAPTTTSEPSSGTGSGTGPLPAPEREPGSVATGAAADQARIVEGVLRRYDDALTSLLRDPGTAARVDEPTPSGWRATIAPGAILADDIGDVAAARQAAGEVVEPPAGQDRSYLHRVVSVDVSGPDAPADRIEFTWCGWSPGIVRDAATRLVVDDRVAHTTGTGAARSIDGTWLLDSLDESTIDLMAPGSPDPCRAGR